ncbi:MAG: GAF domain-containing sensor histidine kinase [Candidatus Dormibacteraeota bacterium]|nr:GAF domain-containing sensor histidine kinase [Candidatus Dormibacteraeota bacterium]MBV9524494.1 GAF domain-containing sensor histidine kinase [Candidatus Dormibacteraeota bacterium]
MTREVAAAGPGGTDVRERRRSALVADIALDLSRARVPEDVNRRLVARATEALDADRATLVRRTQDDVSVEAVHERNSGAGPGMKRTLELPLVFDGEVIGWLTVHRVRDEPFDDDDAATLQLIGIVAVVTLRNARFHAENLAAKQAMSDLLSTVMHETRSPLAIVGGYLSMIREGVFGPPPPALDPPLETIEGKVREAQGIVDELLLASRLENGDIPFRAVAVDLRAAAERAAERAGPRATLLGAQVRVHAPDEAWGRADAGHVDRILDNLVNNALLHAGPSAQVTITAVGGEQPALLVSDNGEGVMEADRERIFERFFRGGDSPGGAGLGLYISRRLAGRWGGSLDLDAEASPGARFVLSLPRAA